MERKALLVANLVCIVIFVLYIVAACYCIPYADDYCFGWTNSKQNSLGQRWLDLYIHWNGRYTADFLIQFHPISQGIFVYRLFPIIALLVTPVSIYLLAREVCKFTGYNVSRFRIYTLSLSFTVIYLSLLPQLSDGIYWFTGLVNYHFGIIVFVLNLLFLIRFLRTNDSAKSMVYACLVILSIFLFAGFNEIAASFILLFYSVVTWLAYQNNISVKHYCLTFLSVALLCFVIVAAAPGNLVRADEFKRPDLLYCVSISFLQTIRFLIHYLFNPAVIAITLGILLHPFRLRLNRLYIVLILLLGLSSLYLSLFIPYVSTGILGQHRTVNFSGFILLLSYMAFLFTTPLFKNNTRISSIFFLLGVISVLFFGNTLTVLKDLHEGNFVSLNHDYSNRHKLLLTKQILPYPLPTKTHALHMIDARCDTTYFADKCMMRYYNIH